MYLLIRHSILALHKVLSLLPLPHQTLFLILNLDRGSQPNLARRRRLLNGFQVLTLYYDESNFKL